MPHITFISGPCGCGKSTLADAYARHLVDQRSVPQVYVIHGDDFHDGFVENDAKPVFSPEGRAADPLQWEEILSFNWECLLSVARSALTRGLNVIIDYVVETELPRLLALAEDCSATLDYVVLTASEEALRQRITARGDTDLLERAAFLKHELEALPENQGHLLDNTRLTLEEEFHALDSGAFRLPTFRLVCGPWQELEAPVTALRAAVFLEEQGIPVEEVFDGADPDRLHAVLLEGETPLSCASLGETAPGKWEVHWVATARAHRGRGLARQVLDALFAAARERGGKSVALEAQSTAVGFYEKLGFTPCGKEIRFPSGFVLLPMNKSL